jgi:LacI family transcriptional regulator
MYAKMARPSITTVRQNPTRKGELAVEYLMRQLGGETMVDINIDLPVELIVRDTVKKLD